MEVKGANVDGDHLQGAAEEPPGQVRPRSSETISIIEIWSLGVLKLCLECTPNYRSPKAHCRSP